MQSNEELYQEFIDVKVKLDQLKETKRLLSNKLSERKIKKFTVGNYKVVCKPNHKYNLIISEEKAQELYPKEYEKAQKLSNSKFAELIKYNHNIIETTSYPVYYVTKK